MLDVNLLLARHGAGKEYSDGEGVGGGEHLALYNQYYTEYFSDGEGGEQLALYNKDYTEYYSDRGWGEHLALYNQDNTEYYSERGEHLAL